MSRIELVIGRPLDKVDAATLQTLVAGSTREDTDLDFKEELYGRSDEKKRDLAGDVAAMANTVGGVIMIGVAETDGAATGLTPVALTEDEDVRMRQVVTALVAPVPQVTIYRVSQSGQSPAGFYLISIPQSVDAPHAVRVNEGLRYPRRDGARIRWLSESEVADAYRSRFQQAAAQVERLDGIFREGTAALDLGGHAWLAIAMAPLSPGKMEIRQRTIREAQTGWIGPWASGTFGRTAFAMGGFDVSAGVGRIVISAGRDAQSIKSQAGHAELYQDGAGFAAVPTSELASGPRRDFGVFVDDETLVNGAVSALGLLVDHASHRCGAVGDAIAEAQIVGPDARPYLIGHHRQGPWHEWTGARRVSSFPTSRHQINLEDCRSAQGLLIAARMFLTDVFQVFGVAEVPQITADGELRRPYFRSDYPLDSWATPNAVPVVREEL
jgi:hypothetical protein